MNLLDQIARGRFKDQVASKEFNAHLAYVAFSRHQHQLQVFADQWDFKNPEMFYNLLSRERIKSMATDYAISHGIEPRERAELNTGHSGVEKGQRSAERQFSFSRAMEGLKEWIQGAITLKPSYNKSAENKELGKQNEYMESHQKSFDRAMTKNYHESDKERMSEKSFGDDRSL